MEPLKLDSSRRLGENVGNHLLGWDIEQFDVTRSNGLADEMKMYIDVLGTTVESGIVGYADGALVVTVKSCWQG